MSDRDQIFTTAAGDELPYIDPDTAVDNSQPQNSPMGNSATADELAAYLGTSIPRDVLDEIPGETFTKYTDGLTEYGEYRTVNIGGIVATEGVQLAGWSFYDTATGSTAFTVTLHDGADASAPVFAVINLANGSLWCLPGGIRTRYGLFVGFAAGAPKGTLYTRNVRAD